jgi:hypothetical protein
MCFISKEDITLEILYTLVLVLSTIVRLRNGYPVATHWDVHLYHLSRLQRWSKIKSDCKICRNLFSLMPEEVLKEVLKEEWFLCHEAWSAGMSKQIPKHSSMLETRIQS